MLGWVALALAAQSLADPSPAEQQMDQASKLYLGRRYADAFELLLPLAESGHPRAQAIIAIMYRFGEGVRQDSVQALNWYQRAAESGHLTSQYHLGILLLQDREVDADPEAAKVWLETAATQGHAGARSELVRLERLLRTDRDQIWSRNWNLTLPAFPEANIHAAASTEDGPASSAGAPAIRQGRAKTGSQQSVPYKVQLGAMSSQDNADRLWQSLTQRLDALQEMEARFEPGPDSLIRVQAGAFADRETASAFCRGLLTRGLKTGCFPVPAAPLRRN